MSHAHEAAVAEARQGWRLEFWRRVADARFERWVRLIYNSNLRVNVEIGHPEGNPSDWRFLKECAKHYQRQIEFWS